jgi:hypothetical protein
MDKFVRTNTRTSSNEDQPNLAIVVVAEQPNTNEEDHDPTLEENVDINTNGNDVTDHDPIFDSSHIEMIALINSRFLPRISMTQEIVVILITSRGIYW